jgi:hypothetical protein
LWKKEKHKRINFKILEFAHILITYLMGKVIQRDLVKNLHMFLHEF